MMSSSNAGMQDATVGSTSSGSQPSQGQGQGPAGHRNVQFRVSAAQQQQLQQHHQQQQQQQHQDQQQQSSAPTPDSSGLVAAGNLPPTNHPSRQQQSFHYQDPGLHQLLPPHGMAYSQSSLQIYQQSQSQQQRPPIAPSLQPRLHHSASAGNITMISNSNRIGGMTFDNTGSTASVGGNIGGGGAMMGAVVMPKKKDPYATAWRTYSKIAEELSLLNPDGTLYPISKEAILKYLHHQSKRIKSSNLHWYVNGLKKHQENLGFPWDDVRYDEQVVGLLRELTLHPVMMTENGDDEGHGHSYGSQANRQRQSSGGVYIAQGGGGGGRIGHHYSSSSIDTTQIANLSISQRPHPSLQQQQPYSYQQQQPSMQQRQSHQQQQRTQMPHSNKQLHQQQQQQVYANHPGSQNQPQQRLHQQMTPQKSYSTPAPILMPSHHARTPSAQDLSFRGHASISHGSSSGLDSRGSHPDSFAGLTSSALSKRKRDEPGFKKRRIPTSASLEGEEVEEDDIQEDELREDDDELEERRRDGVDEFDDMDEDPNRYQPLKRRASTGTLLSQARASAVKHVPGLYATSSVLYQKPVHHARAGEVGSSSALPPQYHTPSRSRDLRSPSPDLMQDESSTGFAIRRRDSIPRVRDSPPESTSSSSSASSRPSHLDHRSYVGHISRPTHHFRPSDGDQLQQPRLNHHRHTSSSGSALVFSPRSASEMTPLPLSSRASASNSGPLSAPTSVPGKNTVQFSEVAEYAQLLQVKYGTRCKDHPWGCVEIASGQHLELTIKMYLDWAGLVASGRLTMDELPDLPEFRIVHSGNTAHSLGSTLRRMASTPFTRPRPPKAASSANEDLIMTTAGSNKRTSVGPYRSPSSSPPTPLIDKDVPTDNLLTRTRSSSTSIATATEALRVDSIALRSIPSPPSLNSSGGGNALATRIDDETKEDPGLRRPRKMASTPSLSHAPYSIRLSSPDLLPLHDQQQQQSNIRSRERRQRMQSSPRSPIEHSDDEDIDGRNEDGSDNDDLENEGGEDEGTERRRAAPRSNQYALDPWSMLRGSSTSLRRTTIGSTPDFTTRQPKGGIQALAEAVEKPAGNCSSPEKKSGGESPSSMEVEQEVIEIGLISEAPLFDTIERAQVNPCSSGAVNEDQTTMMMDVEGSSGSAVDAAAMVLDSMKIGRTPSTTKTTLTSTTTSKESDKQHTESVNDAAVTLDQKDVAEGTAELRNIMMSG